MMKATVTNGILTVETGIDAKDLAKRGKSGVTVYNSKDEPVFVVRMADGTTGNIAKNELSCNVVMDDGTAAYREILAKGVKLDTIKEKHGEALVIAFGCIPVVSAKLVSDSAAIDAVFATADIATEAGDLFPVVENETEEPNGTPAE